MNMEEVSREFLSLNFSLIHSHKFDGTGMGSGYKEEFRIFWNGDEGMLGFAESFRTESLNHYGIFADSNNQDNLCRFSTSPDNTTLRKLFGEIKNNVLNKNWRKYNENLRLYDYSSERSGSRDWALTNYSLNYHVAKKHLTYEVRKAICLV